MRALGAPLAHTAAPAAGAAAETKDPAVPRVGLVFDPDVVKTPAWTPERATAPSALEVTPGATLAPCCAITGAIACPTGHPFPGPAAALCCVDSGAFADCPV